MESILKELWHGNIVPQEDSRTNSKEMKELHWISVLLPDAPDDVVQFLVNASFEVTRAKKKAK